MSHRQKTLGLWLGAPLFLAAVALAGWTAGGMAGPQLTSTKLFPLAVAGLAGALALVYALVAAEPAWILSAGLALSLFSGSWSYMHIPGPVDRVVIISGLVATVVRSLRDARTPRLEIRRVHWILGLLVVYAVGSAAWAGTLRDHSALFALLDRLGIVPFLLYLVAPVAFATERQRRILLFTLVAIGVYLGLTAVFELAGVNSLVFPSYINDPTLGIHGGRARGPFLEAGADGLAMFASAVAAVMLISKSVDRRAQRLLGLVAALCVLGIVLTLTRQVWAGCAIGAALAAVLSPRLRRYVPITAVAVALIAGGALVAIPSLQAKLSARAADQSSIWDRLNSDAAALRMFEQKPLLGFGWGEFPSQSRSYYHVAASYPLSGVAEVHNVVLSNAAELGAIGLGLWLVALGAAFAAPFFRRGPPELDAWKLGLVAVAVAWFVQSNFAPVSYAFDNYMPWLFAGVAMGPVWKRRSQAAGSQRREDLAR